jgi:hypothetical protein
MVTAKRRNLFTEKQNVQLVENDLEIGTKS